MAMPHKIRRWSAGKTAVLLALALAALPRFCFLAREGYWLDEVMQIRAALGHSLAETWRNVPRDKPPLAYLELYLLTRFGLSECLLRLPSMLASLAGLLLALRIAKKVHGPRGHATLFTGLILALSPLDLQLAREVLPYAQSSLFTALFCAAGLAWLSRRQARWLAAAFGSAALAVWFAYQALAPLLAVAALLALAPLPRRTRAGCARGALALLAAILLACLSTFPLWKNVLANLGQRPPWGAPPFSLATLRYFLQTLSAGFDGSRPNPVWIPFAALALGEGICLFRDKKLDLPRLMVLFWLVAGLAWLFLFAVIQNHWVASRYMIYFIPPFAILVAGGVSRITERFAAGWKRNAAVVLAVLCLGLAPLPTLRQSLRSRPDFRGLARALGSAAAPGDLVLFQHGYEEYCYAFYQEYFYRNAPPSTFFQKTTPQDLNPECRKRVTEAKRLWIVERVYEAYPVKADVKAFFMGHRAPGGDSLAIPWRLEAGGRVLASTP